MLDAISDFTELLIPAGLRNRFNYTFINVPNDRVTVDSLPPQLREGPGNHITFLSRGTDEKSEMIQQGAQLAVKR